MYCGACARDAALVRGLVRRGHDVEVVPLYTPLRIEGDELPGTGEVFLGGVNAFLQQVSPLFRHTPRWLDRTLDSPAMLRLASRFAVRTAPADLGPMTVSVLQGRDGKQRKEVDRLLAYLDSGDAIDVVSITNTLLSGLAPTIRAEMGSLIVCSLQGEEVFVSGLPQPWQDKAMDLLRANASSIDVLVAPGHAYADKMAAYLQFPRERIHVVPPCADSGELAPAKELVERAPDTVGYLSVISRPKGLDILVDAFERLTADGRDLHLRIAGKPIDAQYAREVRAGVAAAGLGKRVEWLGEIDTTAKYRFLHECTVLAIPSRIAESRGMVAIEAMMCGTSVVAPESGIFPELRELVDNPVTYEPCDAAALARAICMALDRRYAPETLATRARKTLSSDVAADRTEEVLVEALAVQRRRG